FYLAYGLFKRTLPVLLDESAVEADELRAALSGVEGVCAVRRVRSRWIGSARAVDLVIEVDARLPTAEAHEIADRLEDLIAERFDVHDVTIHVEPDGQPGEPRARPRCPVTRKFSTVNCARANTA
ncbi:MAG: cation transporter dimerization domain-containing protein, partial [Gammaproteobacteria bacterium]